jgi:DNA-binding transcriptional MerR regulator
MQITELANQTNTSTDRIRYLETKGFVHSNLRRIKVRQVRNYPDEEVVKVRLIIKYFEQGFNYDMAYQKAMEELQQPRLA